MELPADVIEQRLASWPVARLATLGARGQPQQVPIVFVQRGDALWSPVDGKPKSGRELSRVRNIRARPAVSLLLDAYEEDWQRLWWIRVDARARVWQAETPAAETQLAELLAALAHKYPQYREVPISSGEPTLLELRIEAVSSWCASPAAARV